MGLIIYLRSLKNSIVRKRKVVKEVNLAQCMTCNIKVAHSDSKCLICGNHLYPNSVESLLEKIKEKEEEEE